MKVCSTFPQKYFIAYDAFRLTEPSSGTRHWKTFANHLYTYEKGGEDLACVKRGEVGTGVQSGDKREKREERIEDRYSTVMN